MRKFTFLNLFLIVSLVVTFNSIAQTAVAPSGTGTACDPYQISSLDNLYWMTQTSASWAAGKYFIQTANIDAAATSTYFSNGSGGYYGLPTIGSFSNQLVGNQITGFSFAANYDGRNFSIDNLYINRSPHYVALFGNCNNATIKNLILNSPTILVGSTGGSSSVGYQGSSIFMASGSGAFSNIIINNGVLTANTWHGYIGGMFGRCQNLSVSDCSVNAVINASTSFGGGSGGFLGYSAGYTSTFTNCKSTGSFSSSNLSPIGGFVGGTYDGNYIFNKCYSSVNVSCPNYGGGFIGQLYNSGTTITNCYAIGNVTSTKAGGFYGYNYTGAPVVTNCYSKGIVSGTSSGGFGGETTNGVVMNNCFWDTQTSTKSNAFGVGSPTGVLGKTTSEMTTQSTFTNWDFTNIWGISSLVNSNYPNLTFPTITIAPLINGVNSGSVSANQVVCYNASPANIVLSNSCGSIQWQSSVDNTTWTDISGATAATLTAAQMGVSLTTKYFRAVLTGNSNTAYSSVVTVKVNNGLAFDGAGDFVSLGNHSSLNFTGNFTIESWVKVPSVPKTSINTIFSKNYVNLGNPGYMLGFNSWNSSNLLLVFEPSTGSYASNRPLIAGQWNHVAAVVSGNGTFLTFYINGKPAGTASITLSDASSVNEFIGSMDASGNYSLSGTLDELRIWNYALTESELQVNLDNPLVGNETGLVAYYDFNQGVPAGTNTGLTVKDQTSNGINGTFNGISLTGTTSNFVDGNHLSVIEPESNVCFGSTTSKLYYGGLGKTPTTFQWYSNTTASTTGATLISGATSSSYTFPTSTSGTTYYYLNAVGTCASSTTSNFAKVIVSGGITGNDYLYLGNSGNYSTTETLAAVNPWVISNTAYATTTNTGVLSAIAAGSPILTLTTAAGCVINKTINVVPTTWKGTTSSDWNTGSNWNGLYVPSIVSNLIIDNSAANDCNLDQNRTLSTLNFGTSSKSINIGNFNLTVTTLSNATATRYVKTLGTGKLSLTVANNTAVEFPVGNSSYNPVTITNKSGASDVFSARVIDAVYQNGVSGTTVTSPSVNRTWDISKASANAGSGVDFIYKWDTGEVVNGTLVTPTMNHHNGSSWEVPTVTSTTFGSNMLTVVGYTGTFSPSAISEGSNPLPIELTAFNANCTENATTIKWQTASEHNSAFFDVEKSRDGINWSVVETTAAAGNSTTLLDYTVVDSEKVTDVVYYRLNQLDLNGESKIYGPISTNCNNEDMFKALVYPNPTKDMFTLELSNNITQNVSIQLIGTDGKLVYQTTHLLQAGSTILPLSSENLNAGIYSLHIQGENTLKTIKLIVQ